MFFSVSIFDTSGTWFRTVSGNFFFALWGFLSGAKVVISLRTSFKNAALRKSTLSSNLSWLVRRVLAPKGPPWDPLGTPLGAKVEPLGTKMESIPV